MATQKNSGLWLGLLALLFIFKKKKTTSPTTQIIIEPTQPSASEDADFLVRVRAGGYYYKEPNIIDPVGIFGNTQNLDGFEVPYFYTGMVQVRMNGKKYLVGPGDYKILN